MTIRLPIDARNADYEDLVAACCTSLGYFIETSLHLRSGSTDVLELDIVATPCVDPVDSTILMEAKSGDTGFGDLFKMSGWMGYLDLPHGCVARTRPLSEHKASALRTLGEKLNVRIAVISLSDLDTDVLADSVVSMSDDLRKAVISAAWYGRIAQRQCAAAFPSFIRSQESSEECEKANEYRWAIEQAFFAKSPIRRAEKLYDAYRNAPKLSGSIVEYLADNSNEERAIWREARDTHRRKPIQHVMAMEHSARLGIIKNALLHLLEKEAKGTLKTTGRRTLIDWSRFSEWLMPATFQDGLETLRSHSHRERIPYLMQVFVEVFGGFYKIDDDRDRECLAACTGIPADEIDDSLQVFDRFFPVNGGWWIDNKHGMRMMKAVPAVCRGTGCFFRQDYYGEKSYDKIIPKMGFLLAEWHNATYNILKPHLGIKTKSKKKVGRS